jgi:hypothetical protein
MTTSKKSLALFYPRLARGATVLEILNAILLWNIYPELCQAINLECCGIRFSAASG